MRAVLPFRLAAAAGGASGNAPACHSGPGPGYGGPMAHKLVTERLVLRRWNTDDAGAALGAYGDAEVARWLAPAMDRVHDLAAMRIVLQQWVTEDARLMAPAGRWAIEHRQDRRVIGGATLLPLPPDRNSRWAGSFTRRSGATATPPRPGWPWRGGHSSRASNRSSRWCGRPTRALRRRCGESAWSGSARRRSTTICTCRNSACVPETWPAQPSPRISEGTAPPQCEPHW